MTFRSPTIRIGLCAVLLLSLACGEGDAPPDDRAQTRAIMAQVFSAMRTLLPTSADPERFSDEANRAGLIRAFDTLAQQTGALESHVDTQDLRFSYLARNVSSDASAARRAFVQRRFERSAFLLGQITENCIVCHSRLPSAGDSPLAEQFLTPEALADVPLERRSALQIATRRFDAALASLEEIFVSSESAALMLGPLTDYLTVSIRVKGELDRPARTLQRFLKRDDLWESFRGDVEDWMEALGRIEPALRQAPNLATARRLFDQGVREDVVPGSRSGLVYLIAASAILERFSIAASADPEQVDALAEAYFLLGVVEARIGRNYWVSEAPFFLETAIRLSPTADFARDAFALLERELLMEYEGADEEELPAEDLRRLAELEALLSG
jgi:hypothetical protein